MGRKIVDVHRSIWQAAASKGRLEPMFKTPLTPGYLADWMERKSLLACGMNNSHNDIVMRRLIQESVNLLERAEIDCACRDNGRAVNERKEEWRWRFEPECAEDLKSNATYEEQVSCRKIPDRQDRVIRPNARITVNHYITKSEEDFRVKVERGSGGGTSRTWREFHEMKACVAFHIRCTIACEYHIHRCIRFICTCTACEAAALVRS